MTLNIKLIAELVRLAESSTLSVLEVEQDGMRVRMEKPAYRAEDELNYSESADLSAPAPASAPAKKAAPAPATAASSPASPSGAPVGQKELRSPLVGTFHMMPNGAVEVGKKLKKGQAACVIEAMKLMNDVAMPEDGEIGWFALKEGDMVEYGQLLLTYI